MRVVMLHTHYLMPGGEDSVFAAELALCREMGIEVHAQLLYNRALESLSRPEAALRTIWNTELHRDLRRLIREFRADVVHLHNTFPLASPAVIHAAKAEGIPVVMTLHNYRLICPNALLFRAGRVCEDCVGRLPWPGVFHSCYRGRAGSAVVAAMITMHRAMGTWKKVDRFIALTDFSRRKFIESGLPKENMSVKPNFVYPDPGPGAGAGGYALFVGRLSPEKGLGTLLRAWTLLDGKIPLRIVGEGPLGGKVSEAARVLPGLQWLGRMPAAEVYRLMGEAVCLVLPSECYEAFPLASIEAFAKGTPVVAAGLGALGEIVEDGRTGLHFLPGNPADLAAKVSGIVSHPRDRKRMGREARAEYELRYTAGENHERLMQIYRRAIDVHDGRPQPRSGDTHLLGRTKLRSTRSIPHGN